MASDQPGFQYTINLDEIADAIKEMNSSRVAAAADWLLHNAFPDLKRALDPETIEERVLLVDGLWRTQLFREKGAVERISENLSRCSPSLREQLGGLLPGGLESNPSQVVEVARAALPVILQQSSDPTAGHRENYSFATKFFHWCTRCHFPIMDGNARAQINALQRRHGARHPVLKSTAEMGGLTYVGEYERWIHFYSDLVSGLSAADREGLLRVDHDSLPGRYRYKNSLLRILDKYFWWRGGRGGE
jgi:hypothetical protein